MPRSARVSAGTALFNKVEHGIQVTGYAVKCVRPNKDADSINSWGHRPALAGALRGEVVQGRSPVDIALDTARTYDSMARATLNYARQLRRAGHPGADAEFMNYARLKKAAEEELEDAMLLESGASIDTINAHKRAYRVANRL
jgi:hypothetical protein